jgi:putative two-component system response regulator
VLGELLKQDYHIRAANSGERALHAADSDPRPDLILLDVMMPGMNGYEVLHLRANGNTKNIPVIFITAMATAENEEFGLELGAVDYITKPFNPSIVLARVHTQLELKRARDRLADENDWLEREVARRMRENLLIQDLRYGLSLVWLKHVITRPDSTSCAPRSTSNCWPASWLNTNVSAMRWPAPD